MNAQLHSNASSSPYLLDQAACEPASWVHNVVLKRLRTEREIAAVLHLREEIDLSVHAAAGQQRFAALEKKEMS